MKKLMVMLSAAALAFGLHAAGGEFISGTAFEDGDGGTSGDLASGYWTLPAEGKGTATITEGSHGITQDGKRPEKFAKAADANNLVIKTTFGNPVELKVDATGKAEKIGDGGLYFDGLVNMTVCDYEDTPVIADENAKLAVYLQAADAEETETKLVIKAGYIGGAAKTYDCAGLTEGWHRLTIKAIKNIYTTTPAQLGFVVFVDGNAVNSTDEDRGIVAANLTPAAAEFNVGGKLFPSMVNGDDITYIGFDGQGKVDELVFTSKAPDFAKDSDFFTLSWEAGVTGFTCGDIVKSGLTEAGSVPVKITLPEKKTEEEPSVVVNVTGITYAEDKVGEATTNFTATAENLAGTITAGTAAANFNGKGYATVAEAIDDANGIKEAGNYTLKLFTGASDVVIANETENFNLTIDLAGKTIAQESGTAAIFVQAGNLIIEDTVGGGIVAGNGVQDENVAVLGMGVLALTAGQYDGVVGGTVVTVSGETTKISVAANADVSGFTVLPEGKVLVKDNEESPVYWIVGEPKKATVIFICQKPAYEKSVEVTVGETVEVPEDFPAFVTATWKTSPLMAEWDFNDPVEDDMTLVACNVDIALEQDADDNYLVDDAADLQKLQQFVAAGCDTTGKTFKQTADTIDLAGIAWAGIGTYVEGEDGDACFAGTYDGNGKEIINLELAADEYTGLFQQLSGTLKNLTINCLGWVEDATGTLGGAIAVGHACDGALISNVTTTGALTGCTKNVAGIAARVDANVTIENCTNEADLSTSGTKAGGIAAITDNNKRKPQVYKDVVISGCKNTGDITATGTSTTGVGGILGYAQIYTSNDTPAKTLIKDCVNEGVVSETSTTSGEVGTILGHTTTPVTFEGVNVAAADKKIIGTGTTVTGADYGTVADNKVTFPATLAKDTQFLVIKVNAAPAFELAAENDYIAFDTALAAATFDDITSATGVIETNELGTVTKFTAKAAAVGPMKPLIDGKEVDPADIVNTAKAGNVIKLTPGCNVTIDPATNELKVDGVTAGTFPAYYVLTAGEDAGIPTVSLAISEDLSKNGATIAADETTPAIQVTDGTFKINLPQAKEGLYYGLEYADNMQFTDSTTVWAQDGTVVSAPAEGNGKFYRVVIDDKAHDGL